MAVEKDNKNGAIVDDERRIIMLKSQNLMMSKKAAMYREIA